MKPDERPHVPTTDRPPLDQLRTAYRIVRAPSQGELHGLILSDQIHGVQTHFYKGRTRPHTQPYCEACDDGHGPRWQGYLAILLTRSKDLALFEFTGPASAPLVEYTDSNKGLRGAVMRAYRMSPKPNARVCIRLERGDVDLYHAPPAPNVAEILDRIWGVKRLLEAEKARVNGKKLKRGANPQPNERQK